MRRAFVIPDIALRRSPDRSHQRSLQQQITSQIADAVRKGVLREGVRLPSSRLLASLLRISRSTVVLAYEDLIAEGLLRAKPGSGVQVLGITATAGHLSQAARLPNLRRTIRASHYPRRTLPFEDPDGTRLYLNTRP